MSAGTKRAFVCPLCSQELHADGAALCCELHGAWFLYGARLLLRGPRQEVAATQPFTMPWEQPQQVGV